MEFCVPQLCEPRDESFVMALRPGGSCQRVVYSLSPNIVSRHTRPDAGLSHQICINPPHRACASVLLQRQCWTVSHECDGLQRGRSLRPRRRSCLH